MIPHSWDFCHPPITCQETYGDTHSLPGCVSHFTQKHWKEPISGQLYLWKYWLLPLPRLAACFTKTATDFSLIPPKMLGLHGALQGKRVPLLGAEQLKLGSTGQQHCCPKSVGTTPASHRASAALGCPKFVSWCWGFPWHYLWCLDAETQASRASWVTEPLKGRASLTVLRGARNTFLHPPL